jgi:hypothetical protein
MNTGYCSVNILKCYLLFVMQVGIARPYTVKTIQHGQASPRVEPPRQTGQGETKEYMVKNGAWRGQRS